MLSHSIQGKKMLLKSLHYSVEKCKASSNKNFSIMDWFFLLNILRTNNHSISRLSPTLQSVTSIVIPLKKSGEILLLFMMMPLAMLGTFIGCFAIATFINLWISDVNLHQNHSPEKEVIYHSKTIKFRSIDFIKKLYIFK